jgi:hypothetical protein
MLQQNKFLTNWAIHHFHVFAYKKGNLVYVPTMKAASTYYISLCSLNGFERINFNEINWEIDHVFGFIMEPIKRYFKGIVEDIVQNPDPNYKDVIYNLLRDHHKFCLPITPHCMPITVTLSDRAYQIDWIPLYEKNIRSHEIFRKLCRHHGITIDDTLDGIDPHYSNGTKKDLFDLFYKLADSFNDDCPPWFMSLVEDIELYHNVVEKMNPNGKTWTEISWLSNTNNVQCYAEDHGFASRLECYCRKCQQGTKKETETIHIGSKTWIYPTSWTVKNCCPDCGKKDCPKALVHTNNCINQST